MYIFIWMNLCRDANHEKGCMILGDDLKDSNMEEEWTRQGSLVNHFLIVEMT